MLHGRVSFSPCPPFQALHSPHTCKLEMEMASCVAHIEIAAGWAIHDEDKGGAKSRCPKMVGAGIPQASHVDHASS